MRLVLSTAAARQMTTAASHMGDSELALSVRLGSGVISTAPIAVKCSNAMASVSRTAAPRVVNTVLGRTATVRAAVANGIQTRMEAATKSRDQPTRPGTSSACIPRKCMEATPSATMRPPAGAEVFPLVAIPMPSAVIAIATSSENAVGRIA